ncbi:MAG TPA: aldo/keto reductase [Flavitalea sp.]|nr:aldo/keto reductase [Flavitalea sp.]
MEKRQLGNSDLQISPIAFGGNVFGWTIDEKTAFSLLDKFVAAGFNLIDTADVYSSWVPGNKGGESETIIGNWVRARNNRDKVIIATKVGGDMGQGKKDTSKKYITKAVEDSLRRLKTDYVDLYQTHWDVETIPVEETLETYTGLIKGGKVRWIGASNMTLARLKESLAASRKNNYAQYQSLQPLYNLYERDRFEREFEQFCLDNNMGVLSYYSLASGFLTGKYRTEEDFSKSQRGGGIKKYMTERGKRIIAALDDVAAKHRSTPAAVSLAWLIARPSVTAPIASATTDLQLEAFVDAASLKLTEADLKALDIL